MKIKPSKQCGECMICFVLSSFLLQLNFLIFFFSGVLWTKVSILAGTLTGHYNPPAQQSPMLLII